MSNMVCKLLLIEDNPGDVRLIQEMLGTAGERQYVLQDVGALDAALSLLRDQGFDAIILDLGLPDSGGIATLKEVRELRPELPVVVLTSSSGHDDALPMLQAGAQDYLLKGDFDGNLLSRSIRYAIERNRLSLDLAESRDEVERQRSLNDLEKLAAPLTTQATADSYGEVSLQSANPEVFELLIEEYGALLKGAVDQQAYRDVPDLQSRIRGFAQKLGVLRATPRDVVQIHTTAFRTKMAGATTRRREILSAEGQLLLIETMGYLASYYRMYMGPAPHRLVAKEGGISG